VHRVTHAEHAARGIGGRDLRPYLSARDAEDLGVDVLAHEGAYPLLSSPAPSVSSDTCSGSYMKASTNSVNGLWQISVPSRNGGSGPG